MGDVAVLLDKAKVTLKASSDAELARHLGVTRASVSNWRTGRNLPDVVQCATLAGLTGEPLARVLGIVGEARAISREEKAVWHKLAASAAALFLVLGATTLPGVGARDAQASARSASGHDNGGWSIHYAKKRGSARREILTAAWLIGLWIKWKLSRRKSGPDCIEAFAC